MRPSHVPAPSVLSGTRRRCAAVTRLPGYRGKPTARLLGPPPAGDIVLGSECAGVVVAVGAGVNDLRAGDAVVALYGIQSRAPGVDAAATTPLRAASYLADLLALQPRGPYLLGGSSFGGVLAYEMARQPVARGAEVALLAMLDAPGSGCPPELFEDDASILGYLMSQGRPAPEELARLRALAPDARIVVLGSERLRSRRTDHTQDLDWATVIRFQHERIAEVLVIEDLSILLPG
jgi:thioesterase domain-containing protein